MLRFLEEIDFLDWNVRHTTLALKIIFVVHMDSI